MIKNEKKLQKMSQKKVNQKSIMRMKSHSKKILHKYQKVKRIKKKFSLLIKKQLKRDLINL